MWSEGWIHPGEIVLFGSNNFSREPGEWIVLRTNGEEGTALIASVKSVGCVPYHKETNGSVSWDNCFLRIWLNKIFCNFFSDREKEAIREQDTPVSRDGRKTVRDRVFILSEAEAEQLLKDREERILYCPPEYNYDCHRDEDFHDSAVWWLREPMTRDEKTGMPEIPVCSAYGEFGVLRKIDSRKVGVRACMWVDMQALKKKPEPGLDFLRVRLLEKSRDRLFTNDLGEERLKKVLAEYVDCVTHESYVVFEDDGGPNVARITLDYDISPKEEKKARELMEILDRRPYREVVLKTQMKEDEREVLSSMFQEAWMPTEERIRQYWSPESRTRTPEFDESGSYCVKMGRYGGKDLYWRILRNNADVAYCLCETGICSDTFMEDDGSDGSFYWEDSMLRWWLNKDFLHEAFSEEERKHLVTVRTEKDSLYSPAAHDAVFLMSAAEASYLLPAPKERILRGTPDDVSLSKKLGLNAESEGDWWWLRTKGLDRDSFCCVSPEGEIDRNGAWGHSVVCAVRPAIVVDLYDSEIPIVRREEKDREEDL